MADQTADQIDIDAPEPKKKGGGVKSLVFGIVAAVALGGAGFYLTSSGLLNLPVIGGGKPSAAHADASSHGDVAENLSFLPLETIMISLPRGSSAKFLKFTGELEVEPGQMENVTQVLPRIQDVLNTYLRAVDVKDIETPASATMLRAQMLRRVQIVAGEGRIRDVLVTEFVLN